MREICKIPTQFVKGIDCDIVCQCSIKDTVVCKGKPWHYTSGNPMRERLEVLAVGKTKIPPPNAIHLHVRLSVIFLNFSVLHNMVNNYRVDLLSIFKTPGEIPTWSYPTVKDVWIRRCIHRDGK